jgi:hypothetical protein
MLSHSIPSLSEEAAGLLYSRLKFSARTPGAVLHEIEASGDGVRIYHTFGPASQRYDWTWECAPATFSNSESRSLANATLSTVSSDRMGVVAEISAKISSRGGNVWRHLAYGEGGVFSQTFYFTIPEPNLRNLEIDLTDLTVRREHHPVVRTVKVSSRFPPREQMFQLRIETVEDPRHPLVLLAFRAANDHGILLNPAFRFNSVPNGGFQTALFEAIGVANIEDLQAFRETMDTLQECYKWDIDWLSPVTLPRDYDPRFEIDPSVMVRHYSMTDWEDALT